MNWRFFLSDRLVHHYCELEYERSVDSMSDIYSRVMQGFEVEIFVIDNGSRDGSVSEVKKTFPFVHFIENEKNLGFAKGTNQGLQKASGRYFLLLNPDTRVKEKAIEGLVSFMETHPGAGISGAQLLNSDGSKQNSIANFPSLATELLNKSLLRWLFPKKFPGKERDYSEPVEVDSVIGACMMVRQGGNEQVGLLDGDYFLFLEETDWCYRMKREVGKFIMFLKLRSIIFKERALRQ